LLFTLYMLPLGDIIRKHCISDPKLYISSRPEENYQFTKLTECIADIKKKKWMTRFYLGVLFDTNLSFESHVSSICKTAFFHLKNTF